MARTTFRPSCTRRDLAIYKKFLYQLLVPNYLGQPWHYESLAVVKARVTPKIQPPELLWPGYYLLVEFHKHQDCQTHYPDWWRTRKQWVRVSRRLYLAKPCSVNIFYRHHRHWNDEDSVQVKIAK